MLGHTRLTRAAGPAHKPITAHRASTWHTGIAIETSTVDSACMRARQERPRHHHPTTLHAAAPLVARTCSLCSIAVLLFFSIAPAKQVLFRHLLVGRGLSRQLRLLLSRLLTFQGPGHRARSIQAEEGRALHARVPPPALFVAWVGWRGLSWSKPQLPLVGIGKRARQPAITEPEVVLRVVRGCDVSRLRHAVENAAPGRGAH